MKKIVKFLLIVITLTLSLNIKAAECDYSQTTGTNMSFLTLKEVKVYKSVNSNDVLMTIPEGVELNSNKISGLCEKNYYEIEYNNKKGWILVEVSHDSNFATKETYLETMGEKKLALLTLDDLKVYKTYKLENSVGVIPKYDIYEITYYTIGDNKSLAYVKYNNIEGWISFSSKEAILEHDCQKKCPLYDREVLEKEITVLNNETKEEQNLPSGTAVYKIDNGKYIYNKGLYTIVEKTVDEKIEPQEKSDSPILTIVLVSVALIIVVVAVVVIALLSKKKKNKEE